MTPLVTNYLPTCAEGARTGIAKLAPHLIGENPVRLEHLNRRIDALLKDRPYEGRPYAMSALDAACWEILT